MNKFTEKQRRFIDEYILEPNATRAAIRAGYSARTARSQGQRLLTNVDIREKIREQMESRREEKVIEADEILELLSSVIRGEARERTILGGQVIEKAPSIRDRIRAAELLGKRYGLWSYEREEVTVDNIRRIIKQMNDDEFETLIRSIESNV